MPALVIGETERAKIAEMIAYARAHPIPLEVVRQGAVSTESVLRLQDRKPGLERPASQHIVFPGGFRAAFSVEQQPMGFCSHLSISVMNRPTKGAMPHPAAVEMICREFGVPFPPDRGWTEEFEPGEYAINLLSLMTATDEGHA
jgi:hypothetical protein